MYNQRLKHEDGDGLPAVHSEKSLTLVPRTVDPQRLIDIHLSNKSPQTITAYRKDLKDFARFLGIVDGDLDEVARLFLANGRGPANSLAAGYRTHLEERRLSPSTVNRRLSALRSLVEQAGTLGLVTWELKIKGIKTKPYRDTEGPGIRNIRKMLGMIGSRKRKITKRDNEERPNPKAIRDFAILRLLYDLALRRGEVVSLDVEDADLEGKKIEVKGKGRAEKEILSLPQSTVQALQDWIRVRGDANGPLFINYDRAKKGNRLTGAAVYSIIRKVGKEIGITTRPHGLRHSAITACVDQFPLTDVQKFSRHKKIETVAVYADNKEGVQSKIADFVSATA